MKRKSIIIILSAVTMLIVLVGCGGNKSEVNTNNNISNQEKTVLANNENPINIIPNPKDIITKSSKMSMIRNDSDAVCYIITNYEENDVQKYLTAIKDAGFDIKYYSDREDGGMVVYSNHSSQKYSSSYTVDGTNKKITIVCQKIDDPSDLYY